MGRNYNQTQARRPAKITNLLNVFGGKTIMREVFINILFSLFLVHVIYAQHTHTQELNEVLVFASFSEKTPSGYSIIVLTDSLLRRRVQKLTSLLNQHTNIYFKEQGYGMTSSISLRGSGASHTAVYWNGIPINSLLNGQTDFNTLFSSSYNRISIRKGGSSVLLGSGAIGGAINLENKLIYDNKTSGDLGLNIGSFESFSSRILAHHATVKTSIDIVFNTHLAKNNYPYYKTEITNDNAEIKHYNFLFNMGFVIDDKNEIYLKANYNNSDRNTSRTLYSTNNANLSYKSHLALLAWKKQDASFKSELRTAYIRENYLYVFNKDLPEIFSNNYSEKYLSKYGINYQFSKKIQINSKIEFDYLKGNGTSIKNTNRKKIALIGGLNHQLSKIFNYNFSIRKDWSNLYKIPIVFSIDSKQQWSSKQATKFNFSTNYRIPTLNDLYWQLGGNTNLLPESNWSTELGYEWQIRNKKESKLHFGINVFNSQSKNLIQWRPVTSIMWKPFNIQNVTSNGVEITLKAQKTYNYFKIHSQTRYSYTRSKDKINNMQLIYTPKHMGSVLLDFAYKNWSIMLNERYNGRIFTTTSNSKSIADFLLTNLSINTELLDKRITVGLQINNLLNKEYQVVISRPMPKRNYGINLNYKF
jgi:iron complex outermembrane receptor protein